MSSIVQHCELAFARLEFSSFGTLDNFNEFDCYM